MRVRIAGAELEIGPVDLLSGAETALLERCTKIGDSQQEGHAPIRFAVVPSGRPDRGDLRGPATVRAVPGRVYVEHPHFDAEVSLAERTVVLRRSGHHAYPLAVALRIALASLLPASGAVPLHAAGVVLDGCGVVCLGPSGAGKSTIAAAFDGVVASEETVVIGGDPPWMETTGLLTTDRPCGPVPVAAFLVLDRGVDFSLAPLGPRNAFRSLLESALVPAEPQIRCSTISTLSGFLHHVPAFRIAWSPSYPVWERIRALLCPRPTESPTRSAA